jgi:indole-3-glycerol phosphate synthase
MPVTLDQMVAATRHRLAETRVSQDRAALERQAETHVPRGFRRALETVSRKRPAVIAELKKASPSRGLIRSAFDPPTLAKDLEAAGAAALSVLTDAEFFQGSLENLRRTSSSVEIPCLRKDFIVDEFQILEARANSADAILLIVAALSQPELVSLAACASHLGMDALCEVHDAEELRRAVDAGCNLIGVNNRNLRTFKVDLQTSYRLAELMPADAVKVAESGIHSGADITGLRAAGYHAFLIGEALMAANSPGEALRTMLAEATAGRPKSKGPDSTPAPQ